METRNCLVGVKLGPHTSQCPRRSLLTRGHSPLQRHSDIKVSLQTPEPASSSPKFPSGSISKGTAFLAESSASGCPSMSRGRALCLPMVSQKAPLSPHPLALSFGGGSAETQPPKGRTTPLPPTRAPSTSACRGNAPPPRAGLVPGSPSSQWHVPSPQRSRGGSSYGVSTHIAGTPL